MEIEQAIQELRKQEKRKFDQSVDLLINLKGLDLRKETISTIISIPNSFKDKKVCGFLTRKSDIVKTVMQPDFIKYKDKKMLKTLIKSADFFISHISLMPQVATIFGKVLGPTGKMPSPQLGVLPKDDDASIEQLLKKINTSIKVRLKEPSFKTSVGKEKMTDKELKENILAVYNGLVNVLPVKKDNVKSVMLKTTMGKPIIMEIK